MVEGFHVSDNISLTDSAKTQGKNISFLSVNHAEDFLNLQSDGLLGLAPSPEW